MDLRTIINSDTANEPEKPAVPPSSAAVSNAAPAPPVGTAAPGRARAGSGDESLRQGFSSHHASISSHEGAPPLAAAHAIDDARLQRAQAAPLQPPLPPTADSSTVSAQTYYQPRPSVAPYGHGAQYPPQNISTFPPYPQTTQSLTGSYAAPSAYNQPAPGLPPSPYASNAVRPGSPPRGFSRSHSLHHPSTSQSFPLAPPSAHSDPAASAHLPQQLASQPHLGPAFRPYEQSLTTPAAESRQSIASSQFPALEIRDSRFSRDATTSAAQDPAVKPEHLPSFDTQRRLSVTERDLPVRNDPRERDVFTSPRSRELRSSIGSIERNNEPSQRSSYSHKMDDVVTTPAPAADGTSRHLQSSPADKPHMASYSPSTAASYVPMQSKRPSFEMEVERERAAPPPSSAAPPAKRRKRYTEVPVFARRAQRKHGHPPVIPPPEQRNFTMFNWSTHRSGSDRVPPSSHLQSRRPTSSGHPEPMSFRDTAPLAPEAAKPFSEEPSITGFIPHEEITKVICDFLYQHVVDRKDIGVSGPGGNSGGQGAVLEVEAKLGRLIDRTRGDRLRLPVLTETVVDKETSGLRLGFKSSMTLDQHRALNNFLNTAITQSRLPNTKRVPMSYAHHKQRDIFYDLPPALVPIMIRHHLRPGHTPRVRVTVDQKTGEVIAKIVKCRLADLDVYSPRTCLDWRLSVNIEMAYDGDISELTPSHQGDDADSKGDRVKDRMSYMHMAYQVDLTQVEDKDAKTSGQSTHPNFEHELEIEISTAEVRRQGELAAANSANQYEELIKGFVDNVRILVRNVPPF